MSELVLQWLPNLSTQCWKTITRYCIFPFALFLMISGSENDTTETNKAFVKLSNIKKTSAFQFSIQIFNCLNKI
jgi:hypothetical protein